MNHLPLTASDTDLLYAVREWVGLLVDERYDEAFDALYHIEPFTGNELTARDIRAIVTGDGRCDDEGIPYRVTPPNRATGAVRPRHDVHRVDGREVQDIQDGDLVASIWFDLPPNGVWSDLTATFMVLRAGDGLVLRLENIDVM